MRILLFALLIGCCQAVVADSAGEQRSVSVQDSTEIPYKRDSGEGGALFFKIVLVMGLLLGVAGGTLFLLKKSVLGSKLGIAEARFIRLVELKRLSPKLNVYLIAVNNRHYVLAQSGESLSIVEHTVPDDFNKNAN